MKHMAKKPIHGFMWNPILKHPRNEPCFCGSKIKFKKCCLPNVIPIIKDETAVTVSDLVKKINEKK